jgi:hypothetical protein
MTKLRKFCNITCARKSRSKLLGVKRLCKTCGKLFDVKHSSQHYCNSKCAKIGRNKNSINRTWRIKYGIIGKHVHKKRKCACGCGKVFIPKNTNQIYYGKRCYYRKQSTLLALNRPERKCRVCHHIISKLSFGTRKMHARCAKLYKKKYLRRAVYTYKKRCAFPDCNKKFITHREDQKYHSKECSIKHRTLKNHIENSSYDQMEYYLLYSDVENKIRSQD